MISLHRSMHSSQMYTPGPAISFLTCRWDLPQKLHRSCSLESVGRAMNPPWSRLGRRSQNRRLMPSVLRDHPIDDSVLLCFLRAHEVVTLGIAPDGIKVLAGVLGDDLVET